MSEKKIFAVYGTLKKGYGNNRLLVDAKLLGEFETPAKYTLFNGGFPVVERGGKTSVRCELYETSDKVAIDRVFSLEGCHKEQDHPQSWYTYDKLDTPYGEAVIFVMNPGQSRRTEVLESGIWHGGSMRRSINI